MKTNKKIKKMKENLEKVGTIICLPVALPLIGICKFAEIIYDNGERLEEKIQKGIYERRNKELIKLNKLTKKLEKISNIKFKFVNSSGIDKMFNTGTLQIWELIDEKEYVLAEVRGNEYAWFNGPQAWLVPNQTYLHPTEMQKSVRNLLDESGYEPHREAGW
jgi:hypothetical protein